MQCVATIERHARAAVSAVTVYTRERKDACLRSAYSRSRKLLIDRDVESTWRPGRVAVLGHAICRRLARIGLRLGRLATVCLLSTPTPYTICLCIVTSGNASSPETQLQPAKHVICTTVCGIPHPACGGSQAIFKEKSAYEVRHIVPRRTRLDAAYCVSVCWTH